MLVNARVAVVGELPRHAAAARPGAGAAGPAGQRRISLDGTAALVPVHRFESLAPDQAVAGPAIIESPTTTILLRPGDAGRMDARGWLEIAVPAEG